MDNININTINNKQYYNAKDLFNNNKNYFYGCTNNPRNIIARKKLSDADYLFAYIKDNKWIISNKSYCKAKLYFDKDWADKTIGDFNKTDKNINIIKTKKLTKTQININAETAPSLIKLNDNEHFVDCNGNKMNIRIRGDRDKRELYFNVKDISKSFKTISLEKNIKDPRYSGYIITQDYKYFNIENKKSMYLTYFGLIKYASTPCNKLIKFNAIAIIEWANNIVYKLNEKDIKQYVYCDNLNLKGMVYIIDSPLMDKTVKIGFWTGNINGLYTRYITYYGKNIEITYFECDNARLMETEIFSQFQKYNVIQELFEKKYKNEYIEYFKTKCDTMKIYKKN